MERPNKRTLLVFAAGCALGVAVTLAVAVGIRGGHEGAPAGEVSPAPGEVESPLPPSEPAVGAPSVPSAEFPYAVTGRVTDGAGRGLSGARVTVRDGEGGPPRRVLSGPDGRFEVANLPLGLYTVEANASGYAGTSVESVTPDGPPLDLRLTGEGAAAGRVVADGSGVPNVIVLIGAPGIFPPASQRTGPDGRFAVETWSGVDTIELAAFGDERGSGFVRRRAPDDGAVFDLPLRPAPSLRLAFTDEVGQDVPTGTVTISSGHLHLLDVSAPIEAGRAELRGLPEGEYYARIEAPGFLPWEGTLTHRAGPAEEPSRLVLSRGGSVRGRVVDATGNGVPDAFLSAVVRDPRGRRWRLGMAGDGSVAQLVTTDGQAFWPPDYTIATDPDGTFHFGGLPAGRLVLNAASPSAGTGRTETIELGTDARLEGIVLQVAAE